MSNLSLNPSKTVAIPLWAEDLEQLQATTAADPTEAHITWAITGRYLGYYIGPGKAEKSWEKPLAKYESRSHDWK